MRRVSIKDIAARAGVSVSTISHVLNGNAVAMRISREQTLRIEGLARAMGYQPNILARSLRTGKTNTIGLIVEDISNLFFSRFAKVIEDIAKQSGYKVVFCSTENDPGRAKELIQMLLDAHVDGFIITPTAGIEPELQRLIELNKPFILFDRYLPPVKASYVMTNNYKGTWDATQLLLRKGYKQIAFITNDFSLVQMQERRKGYEDALAQKGGRSHPATVLQLDYSGTHEQYVKKIIAFLQKNKKTDAIIFATNVFGLAGIEAIQTLKKKIPGDIAVVSFDDHVFFRLHTPAVSVIDQPIEAMAARAVNLLLQSILSEKVFLGKKVIEKSKLIIRESQ